MKSLNIILSTYKKIILFILLGILLRLVFIFFFHHNFDFSNILAIVKSVADTGNLTDGFFVVKKIGLEIQLYGKIYYQILAIWLFILEKIRILEIKYIFDVKAFDPNSYMVGFGHWVLPTFQLISIKLFQFVFDFALLFFIYKIAKLINIKNISLVVAFWALNPFIIYVGYVMYQADLAMVTALTAGVYFGIRALNDNKSNISYLKIISIFFFSLGAVIKQVPILLIPGVLFLYSNSIKSFIIYSLSFALFYLTLTQPWSQDVSLLKQYYLTSRESMALFNFQLNGTPIFFIIYSLFLLFILFKKEQIINKPVNLLYLTAILLSILYITEDHNFLFPQFNIWIMPFIMLIGLLKRSYSIFLIAPIIGFYKRIMIDNDFLTGGLSQTLGQSLSITPKYYDLLKPIIQPELIDYIANSFMILLYALFIIVLVKEILQQNNFFNDSKLANIISKYAVPITTALLLSYFMFLAVDYSIKSKYVTILSNINHDSRVQEKISTKPLIINIVNPNKIKFNALEVRTIRKNINNHDAVILRFKDSLSNKIIFEQKVIDNLFPDHEENFTILFKKSINNKQFTLEILKEKGNNEIFIYQSKDTDPQFLKENMWGQENTKLSFKGPTLQIAFRGQYQGEIESIFKTLSQKPKFFIGYFSFIILIIISVLYVLRKKSTTTL